MILKDDDYIYLRKCVEQVLVLQLLNLELDVLALRLGIKLGLHACQVVLLACH